jgi:hypothetical protein
VEPPRPLVPRRPGAVHAVGPLTLGAAAAAAAVALLSVGDVFAVALLLALVARRPAPAAVAFFVAGAVLVRWGSSSLAALAGAQAVFGPAVFVGNGAEAASAGLGGVALLAAVPVPGVAAAAVAGAAAPRPGLEASVAAAPFGLMAAAVAVGPAYGGDPVLRVVTSVLGVLAAVAIARWGPARFRHAGAIAGGAAALALAVAG